MIHVIVVSHGGIAREIVSIVRLLTGEKENLEFIEIAASSSIDAVREEIASKVSGYENQAGFDGALILTDMLGGSACNICVPLVGGRKVAIVSGVNLYMVLSALKNRASMKLEELKNRVMSDGIRSIADVCAVFVEPKQK